MSVSIYWRLMFRVNDRRAFDRYLARTLPLFGGGVESVEVQTVLEDTRTVFAERWAIRCDITRHDYSISSRKQTCGSSRGSSAAARSRSTLGLTDPG